MTENSIKKFMINFLYSMHLQSDPKDLGFSCTDLANFAISLLLLGNLPGYSGYSLPRQGIWSE